MSTIEKTVTLSDLKDGDVLVMQGPLNWSPMTLNLALDKAIMWLTDSDVCHGALYYGVEDSVHYLVDDGMKGVGQHSMTQGDGENLTWYVRRPTGDKNLQPVLDVASKYKGQSTAYDWELLVMVGVLLLYKKVTPNTLYYRFLFDVLKKIVVMVDNKTHDDSTRYFICSQFVATCFSEAGDQYALDVVDGSVGEKVEADNVLNNTSEQTLIDYCLDNTHHVSTNSVLGAQSEPEELTADDIKQLIESYEQKPEQTQLQALQGSDLSQVFDIYDDFLQLFFKMNASALGLEQADWTTADQRFALIKTYQDDFVTPADLKSHCQNLEDIGIISFVYGA